MRRLSPLQRVGFRLLVEIEVKILRVVAVRKILPARLSAVKVQGCFDCARVRFANSCFAQDDRGDFCDQIAALKALRHPKTANWVRRPQGWIPLLAKEARDGAAGGRWEFRLLRTQIQNLTRAGSPKSTRGLHCHTLVLLEDEYYKCVNGRREQRYASKE